MGQRVRDGEWTRTETGLLIPDEYAGRLGAAREYIMRNIRKGSKKIYHSQAELPPVLASLGDAFAEWQGGVCAGGAVHRTMRLPWHIDRYPPAGATNVLTVFRENCDDGWVVIGETAYTLPEGYAVVFDPFERHGVTQYSPNRRQDRAAFTAYVQRRNTQ